MDYITHIYTNTVPVIFVRYYVIIVLIRCIKTKNKMLEPVGISLIQCESVCFLRAVYLSVSLHLNTVNIWPTC